MDDQDNLVIANAGLAASSIFNASERRVIRAATSNDASCLAVILK
jgi:hypothetical protein